MQMRRSISAGVIVAACLGGGVAVAGDRHDEGGFTTAVKPYAKGVPGSGWTTKPLWSSGDIVPETGAPGQSYRMVGIPDGLGVEKASGRHRGRGWKGRRHAVRVWMTHEFAGDVVTQPRVGRPAQRGAFADQVLLGRKGQVLSARRAFDRVYQDSTLVGPAAEVGNATPAFSRWCSAFLAGRKEGFDRSIFFANEETGPNSSGGPTPSFSPAGSQSVAIFDNEAHALSRLGHFPRENTVVMRGTGALTVILSTEDGPRNTDSQLYMYVGRKDRSSGDPLRRNGLDNGKLYVFASDGPRDNENQVLQGDSVPGHWEEIENAAALTDVQTEAAADAKGAFGFVRIEDGQFHPSAKREFWFSTTGDQAMRDEADPHTNELGRLYRLRFHGRDPLAGATATQMYNADQLSAAQDGPLSPDNIDVTERFIVVNEDGTAGASPAARQAGTDLTTGSRDDMDRRNRDGSIWLVPRATAGDPTTFTRVAELVGRSEGGRDGKPTVDEHGNRAGVWESSGIIVAPAFGRGSFLFDVQAHAQPTAPPDGKEVTGEDGQLMLLQPSRTQDDHERHRGHGDHRKGKGRRAR
jgi:hypothetical protein